MTSSTAVRTQLDDSLAVIRRRDARAPEVAIILGTGLGGLAGQLEDQRAIPYAEIPHFPVSTVESHAGQLIVGRLHQRTVAVMAGRFHYYEGYTLPQVAYPVRVLRALGARDLIVSNVCGGMNPAFARGDFMVLTDHINLMPGSPLIGPNDDAQGPRFPDLLHAYDPELARLAVRLGREEGLRVHEGVYVGVPGPNLETPAEYRFLRMIGADAVGMSTVPEILVAVHVGFRSLAIGCISDMCLPDQLEPVSIEEIIRVATEAEPRLTRLIARVVAAL